MANGAILARMDVVVEKTKMESILRRGGSRLGAGRKPKHQHEARAAFNLAIDARWDKILEKLDAWIEQGDKDILRMLVEQRIGKPSQSLEVSKIEQKRISMAVFLDPRVQEATKRLDAEIVHLIRQNAGREVARQEEFV